MDLLIGGSICVEDVTKANGGVDGEIAKTAVSDVRWTALSWNCHESEHRDSRGGCISAGYTSPEGRCCFMSAGRAVIFA